MLRTALLALLLTAIALPAVACRYSVREVGFVDLDEAPYHFYLYPGNASEDAVARVKRAAYTAFIDAHVIIHEVGPDTKTEADYVKRHHLESFPAGVLVAPEGQSLPVDFPADALEDDDALLDILHPLVQSPKREELAEKVVGPFCTLLLIHGDDAKLNVTTKAKIEAAIEELTDNMDQLEKGTEVPPQLVELTAAERNAEIPLLWSLGLEPKDLGQPRVAVLFGRARRMGSILRADRVSQESLMEVLTLIGASCECGLDRKWMQGPMLLLEWDNTDQAELAKHLGFDPESPLVKTEISQIIAQGMAQGTTNKMDAILGVDRAEGAKAAADVTVEDIVVAEDVPLDGGEVVVEDVPLGENDGTSETDNSETAEDSAGLENSQHRIDLPSVEIPLGENGTTIVDTYILTPKINPLYLLIGLLLLANILGAVYLYRKKSKQ